MTFQSITCNFLHSSGLIDVHVHVRDPGATHKEDWTSCSSAALAGGVTTIFAMPNTNPAVVDRAAFDLVMKVSMWGAATRMNTLNKGFSPFFLLFTPCQLPNIKFTHVFCLLTGAIEKCTSVENVNTKCQNISLKVKAVFGCFCVMQDNK